MTITRDPELEQAAAALYDARLPYHNFGHALANIDASQGLLDRCHRENIFVDVAVVYAALLFHDAGYQDDHHAHGCVSKEAWSAELAGVALRRRSAPPAQIRAVQACILSTRCGVPCQTLEARIVKAADLSGLALGYEAFLQNARRLWHEQVLLTGADVAWACWREQAAEVIERYVAEDLGVTPACYADDGQTWLAKAARANSARLREQPEVLTEQPRDSRPQSI